MSSPRLLQPPIRMAHRHTSRANTRVTVHSLCCDRYRLSFEDRTELGLVASGAVLMDHGVNVTKMVGAEASEVVWLEEDGGAW